VQLGPERKPGIARLELDRIEKIVAQTITRPRAMIALRGSRIAAARTSMQTPMHQMTCSQNVGCGTIPQ